MISMNVRKIQKSRKNDVGLGKEQERTYKKIRNRELGQKEEELKRKRNRKR